MRSEFAGRHSPFRPWLGRVFVKPRGVPSGRADAVAANDYNIAKPRRGGRRPHCDQRPKYDREDLATSHD